MPAKGADGMEEAMMGGWRQREAAQHYLRVVDIVVPRRGEILSTIAHLAADFTPGRPSVLDLGSGVGDVTAAVLDLKPEASVCMVDFSDEMIALSRERFQDKANVRILKHDLNQCFPSELEEAHFDVAISCFALHHVDFESRVGLYSAIRSVLRPGGLFINGDRFRGESPAIGEWEFDNWSEFMAGQIRERLGVVKSPAEVKATQVRSDERLGDKPGTIWQMERNLRAAGFNHVDCIWKYLNLAVVVATR